MAVGEIVVTIRIKKPWWTHLAFRGALFLIWCGVPLNEDRFSKWLAGHFKVSVE